MKPCDRGFTLIEVLVAIFLITVGMGGAFVLIQRTVGFTSVSADRLSATYLCQEGIEIIRNARDTNWLQGNDWDQGIESSIESGLLEKFERKIDIEKSENQMKVSVKVSWKERGRTHQVTAQENLYKWWR